VHELIDLALVTALSSALNDTLFIGTRKQIKLWLPVQRTSA
jgi:hypothetical protein